MPNKYGASSFPSCGGGGVDIKFAVPASQSFMLSFKSGLKCSVHSREQRTEKPW